MYICYFHCCDEHGFFIRSFDCCTTRWVAGFRRNESEWMVPGTVDPMED